MSLQLNRNFLPPSNSLARQTIGGTVALVVITQFLTILLFATLILRPQMERMTSMVASGVASFSRTLENASPELRKQIISDLVSTPYVEIRHFDNPPDAQGPPPRIIERVFMRQLAKKLTIEQPDINWRTDKNRKLWLQIHYGDESFWISTKYMDFGPTGLTLLLILIIALFAILIAITLNQKILKPLKDLQENLDGFRLNYEIATISESGPAEIIGLKKSFNQMMLRIQKTEKSRNIVLAGISHDLRTPLSKLRLAFEMVKDNDTYLKETIQRQLNTLETSLSDFLTYARGFEYESPQKFDICGLIRELALEYEDQKIDFDFSEVEILVSMRKVALMRAMRNLIENSIKYGTTPIILGAKKIDRNIEVSICDSGKGIPVDQIDIITEPFVRLDQSRQVDDRVSTGLGLAIVEKIVKSHDGKLKLEKLPQGFKVSMILPNKFG